MKRSLGFVLNTFCYVFILVLLGIIAIYADCMNYLFPLTFIWYAIAVGASSALLTLIFLADNIIKECAGWLRMALFLVCLFISVSVLSIAFGIVDPGSAAQIATMLVMIAVIFAAVFFVNRAVFRQQEIELTEKLLEFHRTLDE